jgi:hypothetical protein
MANQGKTDVVVIKLTDEQKKLIADKFGKEFADRLQGVEVDKVADFLRSNMALN